jgi:Flp pilus assembly protein TadG
MRNLSRNAFPRRCKGIAIVEFVIVVPICLMLTMATAEFGRAFLQYNTMSKAARDGVRYVAGKARLGSTGVVVLTPELQTETQNVVVYGNAVGSGNAVLPGMTRANVTVTDDGFNNVTVAVSYPYDSIFAFVPAFIYGNSTSASGYVFETSITMRGL